MQAFHNNQKIKDEYVNRVKLHKELDQIIKGKYWENGKGCAVGCTVHSSSHQAYENELGIPRVIARIEDVIFEGLPNDLAMKWPLEFLEAIPIGTDLSMVFPKFMLWILSDNKNGVLQYAKKEKTIESIKKVIELYSRWMSGEKPTREEFRSASFAASSFVASSAAYAAYASAAAYAAYASAAAADAAAYAAYASAAAADAAAYAYASAAKNARFTFWTNASIKLIELLKEQ